MSAVPPYTLCFAISGALFLLLAHLGLLRVQVTRKTRALGNALKCIEKQASRLENEVAERTRAEEQIRHLAMHDPLTGLANRRLLRDFFEVASASARRNGHSLAVLYLDLDNFKPVNDSFGHEWGDMVLCEVAGRLRGVLRRGDIIARVGGDEFVVLLSELKYSQNAGDVAEQIIGTVEEPHMIEGRPHHIGVSIGVAFFPDDGETLDSLMYRADQAMYRVKDSGKAAFSYWRHDCETPMPVA